VGRSLAELDIDADHLMVTALLRAGTRMLAPPADTVLRVDDVVVLFGAPADLERGEARLLGGPASAAASPRPQGPATGDPR